MLRTAFPHAAVFDRHDLRALGAAYDAALAALAPHHTLDDEGRRQLARLVCEIAGARQAGGETLRGAGNIVAAEACDFLCAHIALPLCA